MEIQQNIPLAPLTTFKIGGPARYFVEVSSEEGLIEALKYAQKNNLKVFVLGGGSNILVNDKGFDGLVVKIKNQISRIKMTMQNEKYFVECWAGDNLSGVVNFAKNNSLSGLEWAVGIPGTVGGAVRGNAGAPWGCMSDIVESVRAIKISDNSKPAVEKTLQITAYDFQNCHFSYRSSKFKDDSGLIIVSSVLKLEKMDEDRIREKIGEVTAKRLGKYPPESNPGSYFKNPAVCNADLIAEFEKDTGSKVSENKNLYQTANDIRLPAGWLIERAGLKGKKIGQIQVSEKHANFVVNLGGGRAEDVVALVSLVKQRVRDGFGVELKEEIQYVGF